LLLVLAGVGFGVWFTQREAPCLPSEGHPVRLWAVGTEGGHAPVIGIQPFMEPTDYACEAAFEKKLQLYLDSIRGYLRPGAIVIFPEYVGTWLILLQEHPLSFRASTLEGALIWFVLRRPWMFWQYRQAARKAGWKDPDAAAAFHIKAPEMAAAYHRTFARLAARYGITIVAGSIVLPGAQIVGDSLVVSTEAAAPLENVSVVYGPTGKPLGITRKVYPIATELDFTQPAPVESLRTYAVGDKRLAVLICADSWYPTTYKAIGEAEIWAVPSYLMGDSCWGAPWRGYSGWARPEDVRDTLLSEGQAWQTYAMGGRLPHWQRGAIGLNVFLLGHFWNLGADGRAIAIRRDSLYEAPPYTHIILVWP
jgi:hypothetical protein